MSFSERHPYVVRGSSEQRRFSNLACACHSAVMTEGKMPEVFADGRQLPSHTVRSIFYGMDMRPTEGESITRHNLRAEEMARMILAGERPVVQ